MSAEHDGTVDKNQRTTSETVRTILQCITALAVMLMDKLL